MKQPVIILGAAQCDGRLSRTLRARLDQAVKLHRRDPSTWFITVGGNQPGDRFTEAGVARDFLVARGVDPSQVIAVERGVDTRTSLEAVVAAHPGIDGSNRVRVVTDRIHGPRTQAIARAVGLRARVIPAQGSPTRFPKPTWWRSLAHELGGLIFLAAQRWLPAPAAWRVRSGLYAVEAVIRPSWRGRHERLQQ
ncbi:hypothetical protein CPHO_03570 [Corynebacterium phocae]|uniref:DUF218 domain-containing protein n=1 Tax=Corynebacterium phocae TaxID=161895 RepID=A0A1L7D1Z0_9CORY|nr:YdcF family protein [Corynebacterium phocae]APT92124.1 hypothetical protein CPHO_03570 [Corynebacterium phocae]KAA8726511.1 YdcF family protein [Corynebacterium phocae]